MKNLIATLLFFMSFTFVVKAQDQQPDEVIKAKVIETGLKHRITSTGSVSFTFSTNNTRSQAVSIMRSVRDNPSGSVMELRSYAFKLSTNVDICKIAIERLKENADYKIMSWQVIESEGFYYFVFKKTIPVTVTGVALYRELISLAEEADSFEVKYGQGDDL